MANHPHTLLIVDDHDDIREGMAALLARDGHHAVPVRGGREALARLRDGLRPCVIVLDLAMPDMPGYVFREAQRADPELASIPVIVVSAGDRASEATARALGIECYLRKPIDLDAFRRAVEEQCDAGRRAGS